MFNNVEKEEANEEAVDSTEDEPLISAESASIEPKGIHFFLCIDNNDSISI